MHETSVWDFKKIGIFGGFFASIIALIVTVSIVNEPQSTQIEAQTILSCPEGSQPPQNDGTSCPKGYDISIVNGSVDGGTNDGGSLPGDGSTVPGGDGDASIICCVPADREDDCSISNR